jgi:acyl-CoA ligase (AMP-forming) (exosortase A-associated)
MEDAQSQPSAPKPSGPQELVAMETPVSKTIDHLAFCGREHSEALVLRGSVLSYDMLNLRIAALAQWLMSRGLVKGDRVATWLNKTDIGCLMPLAAARAGLVHVPVNPLLKAPQVKHILSDSGTKLLIANKARLRLLDGVGVEALQLVEDTTLATLPEAEAQWRSGSDHDPDELAAILYTSGSTGLPKGVMLSHANMWLGAVSVAQYLQMQAEDRTLCVLPLSFDYGQNQLLSTWYAGGACYPIDYLTPRDVLKALAKYRITTLAAVPPLWMQLVEQDWPEGATQSLRRLTNSGGALTTGLIKALQEKSPDSDIFPMYGLTEAFRSTYLPPHMVDDNPTSMGKAIPFAEIMLVDEKGQLIEGEGEGELVHAGPLVSLGYWQDQERTDKRFKTAPQGSDYGGIAVYSGDIVRRDAAGLLYFVGRNDAMIKSSGNRISPSEVEEAALSSNIVSEAVAMGRPDARLGESILLITRAADGSLEDNDVQQWKDNLTKYMKTVIAGYMVPQEIVLLPSLPRNANGKIDRSLLAKEYGQ